MPLAMHRDVMIVANESQFKVFRVKSVSEEFDRIKTIDLSHPVHYNGVCLSEGFATVDNHEGLDIFETESWTRVKTFEDRSIGVRSLHGNTMITLRNKGRLEGIQVWRLQKDGVQLVRCLKLEDLDGPLIPTGGQMAKTRFPISKTMLLVPLLKEAACDHLGRRPQMEMLFWGLKLSALVGKGGSVPSSWIHPGIARDGLPERPAIHQAFEINEKCLVGMAWNQLVVSNFTNWAFW